MLEVTRYKCDHCAKVLSQKSSMKKHEKDCFFNPESKSCVSCANFCPSIEHRSCSAGINIETSLQTWCADWIDPESHIVEASVSPLNTTIATNQDEFWKDLLSI